MRFIATVLIALLCAPAGFADTYTCNSVKDRATLGYDGSAKVSIVGEDRVCTFAIGGASVDSQNRPWTFEDERRDFEMLSQDPNRFIDLRLMDLLFEVAEIHGESADFLSRELDRGFFQPNINCFDGNTDRLGDLQISCKSVNGQGFDGSFDFESSMVFAQLSRPKFVISIEDDFGSSRGVYIFLTSLQ